MAELTDAQKVVRNDTAKRMAAALEALVGKSPTPAAGLPGQIPVKQSADYGDTAWEYPRYPRRNLLDNWYFAGGGSQLGNGVFPINQRGQTSYSTGTSSAYWIDRWYGARGSLTVAGDGISLAWNGTDGANMYLQQRIARCHSKPGEMYTASVLLSDGTLITGSAVQTTAGNNSTTYYNDGDYIINCATFAADNSMSFVFLTPKTSPVKLIAAKLELGSYQTLAHQENGEWVLNGLPDFWEELRKCQQYFRVLESSPGVGTGQYFTAVRGYSNAKTCMLRLPFTMAKDITPSLPAGIQGVCIDGAGSSVNLSDVAGAGASAIAFSLNGDLARTPLALYFNSRIYLSAE